MCKDLGNLQYECLGTCNASGSVWGSGLYTGDSDVYRAAKHMGMVPGKFRRVNVAGSSVYYSTMMNGVTTSSYGNYANSFFLICISQYHNQVKKLEQMTKLNQNLLKQLSLKNQQLQKKNQELIKLQSERTRALFQSLKGQIKANMIQHFKQSTKVLALENRSIQAQNYQKYNTRILRALKKDVPLCVICHQNERSRLVFPCSHAAYCQKCIIEVRSTEKCAVCNGKISGDMKIFI